MADAPETRTYVNLPDFSTVGELYVADKLTGPAVAVLRCDGDPNGSLIGTAGQLAVQSEVDGSGNRPMWQNTDDGTTWIPFVSGGGSAFVGLLNLKDFGAVGDGVADDGPATRTALAAAVALGGTLFVPPGVYNLGRDAANPYSVNMPGGNVTVIGVKGQSWFRQPAGMPATPVRMFYIRGCDNVTFSNIGFDGNWGNVTTVVTELSDGDALPQAVINVKSTAGMPAAGTFVVFPAGVSQVITYTGLTATSFTGCTGGAGTLRTNTVIGRENSQAGINQATQVEPNNHLLMFAGSHDYVIDNCLFRQSYGDFIWMGHGLFPTELGWSSGTVRNCVFDMSARSGITCGGPCEGVTVDTSQFYNCYGQAFDTESFSNIGAVRDVTIRTCHLGGWWAPFAPRTVNSPLSIAGTQMGAQSSVARKYRVLDTTVIGSIGIAMAVDVVIKGCRIICDFDGDSAAPINLYGYVDDCWLQDNYIYDRTGNPLGGVDHYGSVSVRWYGGLGPILQPAAVHVIGNRIHSRNGRHGIVVEGTGGFSVGVGAAQPPITGVATAVTATTVTQVGAFGAVNSKAGWQVRIGTAIATVASNDADTLTVTLGELVDNWTDPLGVVVSTPAPGAYVLSSIGGLVDVSDNVTDCTDDGYGAGGVGVHVDAEKSGMRVRVRNHTARNAAGDAIRVTTYNAAKQIEFLELSDNTAFDDQVPPTCINAVRFVGVLGDPPHVAQLVMHDNQPAQGVANEVVGLTDGQWRTGECTWSGFGTPEGSIYAPPGSTYARRDGAGVQYVKETDVTFNTGWTALLAASRVALREAGTPVWGAGALVVPSAPSVDGDIEILVVGTSIANNPITLSTPAGFVAVPGGTSTSTYVVFGWSSNTAIFARRVQGVMSDATVADDNGFNEAQCFAFKGVLEFGDVLDVVDVVQASGNNDNTLPISLTGNTTTVDGALVVGAITAFTGGNANVPTWTNGTLTEVEKQVDDWHDVGSDRIYLGLVTAKRAAAGAFGAFTALFDNVAYSVWSGIVFALKPATGVIGVERITASGAASPNIERAIVSGVATAVTLDAGDLDGFVKTFVVSSGTGTMTPAAMLNGTAIAWTDFGAFTVMWDEDATAWQVVSVYGNVTVTP